MKVPTITVQATRTFGYPNRSLSTTVVMQLIPEEGDVLAAVSSVEEAQARAQLLVEEEKGRMQAYLSSAEEIERNRVLVPVLEDQKLHLTRELIETQEHSHKLEDRLEKVAAYLPCLTCNHQQQEHTDYEDTDDETAPCKRSRCKCKDFMVPLIAP